MNWGGIIFILTFVLLWLIGAIMAAFVEKRYLNWKKDRMPKFPEFKVKTYIKCSKCDYRGNRAFKRGDHMLKDVGAEFAIHDCEGTLFIEGIYYEKVLSKKELKWLKIEERWR